MLLNVGRPHFLSSVCRELLAQRQLDDRLLVAASEQCESAAKKCRREIEESPHDARLCAMFRPGTSLNLHEGLEYHRVLDGPRVRKKPNDFATYRKREPTGTTGKKLSAFAEYLN